MTDRVKGFVVTLDEDLRDYTAQSIIEAIKQLRGVLTVEPVLSRGIDDVIIEQRVRSELGTSLFKVLYPDAR